MDKRLTSGIKAGIYARMQRVDGLHDGNLTIENVATLGHNSRQLTKLCGTWLEHDEPSEAPAMQPTVQATVHATKSRNFGLARPPKRVPAPTEGDGDDGGRKRLEASALASLRTTKIDSEQGQHSFLVNSADLRRVPARSGNESPYTRGIPRDAPAGSKP